MNRPPLVLASKSPQRRALLAQLGLAFTVREVDVEEISAGDPEQVAVENARRKAAAGATGTSDELVLGVDTLVTLDGQLYGKPPDDETAHMTLAKLAGRRHEVISGLVTVCAGQTLSVAVRTGVHFRALEENTLRWYVGTGEWQGRAGGYAIQGRGAGLVAGIEGDYANVVGLPLSALLDLHPGLLFGGREG